MTTTTETWLDILPAIPLAGYCGPLLNPDNPGWRAVAINHDIATATVHAVWPRGGKRGPHWLSGDGWLSEEILRPDLDTPEGMGHALRSFLQQQAGKGSWFVDADVTIKEALIWRHISDDTTDADRMAIAQALRDVYEDDNR